MYQPGGPISGQEQQHVLVVEDDAHVRQALALLLRVAGYTVDEAHDGGPALQRLRESLGEAGERHERLVVLVDWWMPGMNGRQLLEAVAADEVLATRHAYILMTAYVRRFSPDFAAFLQRMHVSVIAKPFGLDTLLYAVVQATARLAQCPPCQGNPPCHSDSPSE